MKKTLFWAPGIIGVANIIFANGNFFMMITGLLLIIVQFWDAYERI